MNMKATEEFAVGKHDIVWINSRFTEFCADASFEKKGATQSHQKLERTMTDAQIESELKPGICDLGDVLTFLENPPEGSKDGYSNIFYFPAFVVSVDWHGGGWRVGAWKRGGISWGAGYRVFSPATSLSVPPFFVPSEPVSLPTAKPGAVKLIYRDPDDEKVLYVLFVNAAGMHITEIELVSKGFDDGQPSGMPTVLATFPDGHSERIAPTFISPEIKKEIEGHE